MRGAEGEARPAWPPDFVARLRRREEAAWEDLYEACERRLRLIALRILPDRLDPEATAQQAWVRAIHHARRLDPGRDPVPWLASICVNLCISVLRRDRLHRKILREQQGSPGAPVRGFLARGGHTEADSRVRKHVSQLSREHQQVVYLRFVCNMGAGDMAAALGVSPATVRKRLSRAYAKLRQTLGAEGPWMDPKTP